MMINWHIAENNIQNLSVIIDDIPGDKSISHRAIIIGAIAKQQTIFRNFLFAEDCLNTIKIFQQMGIKIDLDKNNKTVKVYGNGLAGLNPSKDNLYVGNSGTGIRLISGLLVGQKFSSVIDGDESIRRRPMKRIIAPLKTMGADISGNVFEEKDDIFPPLLIKPTKNLHAIKYELPIASAQLKSALLLASLYQDEVTEIIEPIASRDHTERILALFNAEIYRNNNKILISGQKELISSEKEIFIPSDISSATFFIVLGLILSNSKLIIKNIGLNPTRTNLITILQKMGARINLINNKLNNFEPYSDIEVFSSQLENIIITPDEVPLLIDELPILAVLSLFAKGVFKVSGAKELRFKESDRIESIAQLITSMGGEIKVAEDGFEITGQPKFKDFNINSFFDHRIAMSAVVGSLGSKKSAEIKNCACVNTSFPNFFTLINELGGNIKSYEIN